jgi:PAS domain S-box-containing protein
VTSAANKNKFIRTKISWGKIQANDQHLFDVACVGICIQDANGIVIDCNESVARLHGLKRTYIIGKSPDGIFPEKLPYGRISAELAHEKMLAAFTGTPQRFDFKAKSTDGALFDSEWEMFDCVMA